MRKNGLAKAWVGFMMMAFLIFPLLLFPGSARATMLSAPGGWLVVDRGLLQMFSFNSLAFDGHPSDSLQETAEKVAHEYGLPPQLVKSVIRVESRGDAKAVSAKGAMGLMQLMPDTARGYGVFDPFDPLANIKGGVQYLRDLLQEFSGDLSLALAAYNAGPAAVHKYQGMPPYSETQTFVEKVKNGLNTGEGSGQSRALPSRNVEIQPLAKISGTIHISGSPRDLSMFLRAMDRGGR